MNSVVRHDEAELRTDADGLYRFTRLVPKPHDGAWVSACSTQDGSMCEMERLFTEPAAD